MSFEESVTPGDYAEQAVVGLTSEEKTWGMLCHLSVLLAQFAFYMTFLGPFICWLIKKDSSRFVDHHGKESLNFQLNMLGYFLVSIPLILACGIGLLFMVIIP